MSNVICNNVSLLRNAKGWSQQYLATLMGVTQPTITRWEGKLPPDYKNIQKLSKIFGKPITWFFEEHPEEITNTDKAFLSDSTLEILPESNSEKASGEVILDPLYIERRIREMEEKCAADNAEILQQLKKQNDLIERMLCLFAGELQEIKKNLLESEQWAQINLRLEAGEISIEQAKALINKLQGDG